LDVGQGDSEFIELPNGQTMLIDAGNPENGSGIVSYITSRGHNKIDYLIATHPHADHIGGMATVVDSLDIGTIYMPRTSDGDTPTTSVYKKLLTSIQSKGLKINTAKAGVSIVNTGSLSATMIAPNSTGYGDLNQYSAVIMLTYGKNKFLFMGDAGNTSESEIAADVSADVLKVGHHGSKTATSQKFLNKVHPKQAVIEVGSGNKYGHPTQQALNRLKSIGATVYRTDLCSTIVFTSDSNTITVNKSASSVKEQAPPSSKASTGKATLKSNATITPKSTAPAANNAQGITVYITNTGKKYHSAGCRYLSKSCIPISLSEAKAEGYTPCSRCNPPE
jgi:competence protein ComEC